MKNSELKGQSFSSDYLAKFYKELVILSKGLNESYSLFKSIISQNKLKVQQESQRLALLDEIQNYYPKNMSVKAIIDLVDYHKELNYDELLAEYNKFKVAFEFEEKRIALLKDIKKYYPKHLSNEKVDELNEYHSTFNYDELLTEYNKLKKKVADELEAYKKLLKNRLSDMEYDLSTLLKLLDYNELKIQYDVMKKYFSAMDHLYLEGYIEFQWQTGTRAGKTGFSPIYKSWHTSTTNMGQKHLAEAYVLINMFKDDVGVNSLVDATKAYIKEHLMFKIQDSNESHVIGEAKADGNYEVTY